MSERVRLELHEANDAQRLLLDHLQPHIDRGAIIQAIEDHIGASEVLKYGNMADEIVASIHQETATMRHSEIEDLVNRIGEIYEKALARKGQVRA